MGNLRLPRLVSLLQPQGSLQIDWSNPITKGLISAIDGVSGQDLLAGSPTVNTTTLGAGNSALGRTLPGYLSFPFLQRSKITNQLSCFILEDLGQSGVGNNFHLGDVEAGSVGYNFGIYSNGSPFQFIVKTGGAATGAGGTTSATSAAGALPRFKVCGTYDGSNLRLYVNGLLEGIAAKTGNVDTTPFSLNVNRWNGASEHIGRFYLGLVWNRALSDAENKSLAENPWQVLKPAQRRLAYDLPPTLKTFPVPGLAQNVQPQRAPTGVSAEFGADFAWLASTGSVVGPATLQFGTKRATKEGFGVSSGFVSVSRAVPSMASTTWTECGVALLDGANGIYTLSLDNSNGGQAVVLTPTGLDLVVWDVADVNINGTLPVGIVRYVAKRNGNAHSVWINGVLFGTASSSAVPLATSTAPPAIGARSGGSGASAVLNSTSAILMVARTPKALSDASCLALSKNPWQIFKSGSRAMMLANVAAAPAAPAVTPTGVVASTAVGTPTISSGATSSPAGVAAVTAVGTVTASGASAATVSPAGVAAIAAVGTPIAGAGATLAPDGVAASALTGTAALAAGASATTSGVAAAAQVGTATASSGSGAAATPAGVAASTLTGTATITTGSRSTPAGVAATAQVGTAVASSGTGAAPAPAGVVASSQVGTPATSAGATLAAAGVSASTAPGTPAVSAGAAPAAPGVNATTAVGAPTVATGATVQVVGVAATTAVGTVAVAVGGSAQTAPAGVAATATVGSVTPSAGALTAATGVAATAAVGTATASSGSGATAAPAGVSAAAAVGTTAAAGGAAAAATGTTAAAAVGAAVVGAGATAVPAGVAATAQKGAAAISAGAGPAPAGVAATTSLGSVIAAGTIFISAAPAPAGVAAHAAVGVVVARGDATIVSAANTLRWPVEDRTLRWPVDDRTLTWRM